MRNFQIKSVKNIQFILLILALSLTACGQQKKENDGDTAVAKTTTKAPDLPLNAAIVAGDLATVKKHIAAGTDLNEKDQLSGGTPLLTAITFDKTDIAKALIDAGADLSIKNNDGSTALHVAAFFCRIDATKMLLEAGADKTVKNNYGATPRETVTANFADMKPVYEMMKQQLAPVGLQIDLARIEKTRPTIAVMLQ